MIRNVCKYIFYIWEDSEGVNSHSDVSAKAMTAQRTDTDNEKRVDFNIYRTDFFGNSFVCWDTI